jgi:hypothetical protein
MYYSNQHEARIQRREAREALYRFYKLFTLVLALGLWVTVWFAWALV